MREETEKQVGKGRKQVAGCDMDAGSQEGWGDGGRGTRRMKDLPDQFR